MPNQIYVRLADIFRDHIIELSRMLDHDFPSWPVGQPVKSLARHAN